MIDTLKTSCVGGGGFAVQFIEMVPDMVKVLEIRCKNHLNSEDEYRKIPRLLYEPKIVDADAE